MPASSATPRLVDGTAAVALGTTLPLERAGATAEPTSRGTRMRWMAPAVVRDRRGSTIEPAPLRWFGSAVATRDEHAVDRAMAPAHTNIWTRSR